MSTISQIKVGNTYYDLQDTKTRTNIAACWIPTHAYHVLGSNKTVAVNTWTQLVSTGSSSITYTDAWAIGVGQGYFYHSTSSVNTGTNVGRRGLRLHFTSTTASVDCSSMLTTSAEECGFGSIFYRLNDHTQNYFSVSGTSHVTNKAFVPQLLGWHDTSGYSFTIKGKIDVLIFSKNGFNGC